MPYNEPFSGTDEDWLSRAQSDFALASVRRTKRIRREDLCYHAQQAAEKALKPVLIHSGIKFPRTHNIKILVELLPADLFRDPILDAAAILTDYAVTARYPVDAEPVTPGELNRARHIAKEVLIWAESSIQK